MKKVAHTLYWQIAGVYLVLLLSFAAVAMLLALREFDNFLGEVEQRLNRDLAGRLVKELTPALDSSGDASLNGAAKRINGINPMIDIYLLDREGTVKASLTGKAPKRDRVEVDRIRQFLVKDSLLPIRAIDPSVPSGDKVFSASAVPASLGGGFLYVVLPGMPFETTAHMVRTSYVVRGAAIVLIAVLFTTVVAGLAFFFVLTRRFERLSQSVRRFQEGEFHERADTLPKDQIGRLAATFNEMAATIETQFQALKQTDEARRSFASNISHDFRTPLTALRGYTDRLLRSEAQLDTDERRNNLKAVLHSAAQLEHLADQLATIVHLDGSNDAALKLETFSIAELAQDSIVKFTPLADERGISLSLINPQTAPAVIGDIAMMERVLSNLLDNAINNTSQGGKVRISLPVTDGRVTVRVEDTGCGIASDDVPLVRQRFYRTAASRATGLQGTGLGLAIVDEIITKHGSVLIIESDPGVGTIVSFDLLAA